MDNRKVCKMEQIEDFTVDRRLHTTLHGNLCTLYRAKVVAYCDS